ncbi:MAG: hypothetical protein ABI944_03605 [Chthoniobacterales bacterium]
MQFTHKLKKLSDGRGIYSARHHLRRFFLSRRATIPLDPTKIARTIDPEKFENIRARYSVDDPGEDPPKYLELPRWLEANLNRIRDLELDLGKRRRILDIGSGTGYFLYICGLLGHNAVGIDLDDMPMFNEMTRLLGVKRIVWRIEPFVPLPDLGPPFDVITAHMICFNGHKSDKLWTTAEWDFFLNDLARHLSPRGRVWLEFNREFDGTCYSPQLEDFFKTRGAEINSHRVVFNSTLRAPV